MILGWFDRGDAVPLVADGSFDAAEDWYPVYWNGIFAQVPQDQVRMAEEAPYENWIGGSLKTLSLYADHWLQGDPLYQVDGRTQVQILYELEHCYLVEAGDMTGYAAKEQILPWEELPQSSQIGNSGSATAPETAPTEPIPETTAPEWTPPKL